MLNCFANADIGPAATDVAEHGVVDVGVGRMRVAGKECRGRHDLARLAIAALHYFAVEPRLLNLSAGRRCADRLDRRDFGGADALDRGDTRAGGSAVDMYRARAAQRHATAKFCAGHAEYVAQHPEERGVAVDIDVVYVAVDFDGEGHGIVSLPPAVIERRAGCRSKRESRYPSLVVGCGVSLVRGQTKLRMPSVPLMTLVRLETKLRDSRLQTFRVPYVSAHAECR